MIIIKLDLIQHTNFSLLYAKEQIETLKPGMRIFEISKPKNEGYEEWIDYVKQMVSDSFK